VSKVIKGIGKAIKGVVKGITKAVKKLWKPLLIAGALYFGGAWLMGSLGSAGSAGGFFSSLGSAAKTAWTSAWGAVTKGASWMVSKVVSFGRWATGSQVTGAAGDNLMVKGDVVFNTATGEAVGSVGSSGQILLDQAAGGGGGLSPTMQYGLASGAMRYLDRRAQEQADEESRERRQSYGRLYGDDSPVESYQPTYGRPQPTAAQNAAPVETPDVLTPVAQAPPTPVADVQPQGVPGAQVQPSPPIQSNQYFQVASPDPTSAAIPDLLLPVNAQQAQIPQQAPQPQYYG
jgi:hypothetical protein